MRLRNPRNGTQINVPADKGIRLMAAGIYEAVPDAEQPPEPPVQSQLEHASGRGRNTPTGATSIASAIRGVAGPLWDTAT